PYSPRVALHPHEEEEKGRLEEDIEGLGVEPAIPDKHPGVDGGDDTRHQRDTPPEEVFGDEVNQHARPRPKHAAGEASIAGGISQYRVDRSHDHWPERWTINGDMLLGEAVAVL